MKQLWMRSKQKWFERMEEYAEWHKHKLVLFYLSCLYSLNYVKLATLFYVNYVNQQ